MIVLVVKVLMTALLVWSTVLQLDDPDPAWWILLYGGAALLTVVSILYRGFFGIYTASSLASLAGFIFTSRRVDAWVMDSEVAREAAGLGLVFFWLVCLAWIERSWAARNFHAPESEEFGGE